MQPQTAHRWLNVNIGKTLAVALAANLTLCLVFATRAIAHDPQPLPADATPQQLTERILALQREIDELRARLPAAEAASAAPVAAPPVDEPPAPSTQVADTASIKAPPVASTPPAPSASSGIPVLKRRPVRETCNTLVPLDENGDGRISAADRLWRHLYVWTDKNKDRQMQEKEVESAYARGVREISTSVETFIRSKGNLGEIRIKENIVLDLRGDGFSERSRQDDGVLLIDASAVARGDGPEILDDRGAVLGDLQPFRAGLQVRTGDQITPLSCP